MNFEQKYNNKKQNSTKLLAINDDSQYDHTSILETTIKFQNNTNQINNNKYPIQPHYESNNLKTYKFDNSTKVLSQQSSTQNQFNNPYNHKNTTHSPILNEKNLDLSTNKSHFNNENNQKDITQSYLQFISSSAESPSSSSSSSSNCQNMINKGQSNTLLDDSLTSLQWLQNLNIMKSATNCNNSTNNPNMIYTDTQLLSLSNDKELFLNLSCKKQSKLNDDFISPELDLDCSSAERINLSCQILDLDTNNANNIINNCSNNLINLNNNHINSVNFNSSSASSSSSSPNSFIYQQQIQNIQQQFPLSPAQSSCASSPTSLISIQQPLAITNNTTNNKGVKRSNSAANAANKRAKQTAKTMITSQVKFRLDNNLQSYSVATSTVYSTLLKEREEFRNNSTIKPPYSYSQLIILAMKESSYPKMTLQMIYDWIIENFSYFKKADPSWQITFKNSIRHNLSLNKCFKKIARQKDEPGKGGFWTLDPEFEKQLNETNSTNINVNTSQSNEKNNDLSNLASSPKTSTTPKQLFNFNLNKRRRCQNFANTKSQLNKKSKNKTHEETAQQTADKSLAQQKKNESKDPLESTNTFLSQYDQFNNKNQLLIPSIKMEKNNFTMLKDDYITDQVAIKNEPNSVNDFININIPNQTNQSSMNTNNSMFLFDSNSTVNDNQNNGAPFIMRSELSWLSTESNLNKKVTNCNAKPLNIMNDGDCLISDLLNQNNQQFLFFSPNQSQQTPQHHQQHMVKPVNCYNSSISPVPSFQCNSQNKKSNPNDFYQINNLNNSQNQYISYDNNNINIKPDDSYKIADHLINANALDSNNSHCFEDRNLRTLAGLNNSCLYNNNSNNSLQRLPANLYQHSNHHQMPNHCNSNSHQLINNGNFSTAQSSSLINTNNLMVEDMTGTFSNSFAHEIIKSMDVEGSLFSFEEGLECNFDIDQLDDTTNELSTNHNKNFLCNLNSNHNYFNINNAQHSLQTLQTKQQMTTNLQVNNNNLDEFLNESFKVTPSSLNSKVNTISSLSTSSISSMSSNSSMTSNLRTNQRQQTNNNDNELIELLEYTSKFNLENNQLNAQNSIIPQMHMDIDTKNKLDLTIEGTSIKQPKWWNEKNDECDSSRYFNDYQLDMPIDMNSSSSTSDIRKVTNTQINETNCYNELAIKPLLKKRISNNSNSYYNHRTI